MILPMQKKKKVYVCVVEPHYIKTVRTKLATAEHTPNTCFSN